MDWLIDSYVGVGHLRFGMKPADAEKLLGPPRLFDARAMWTRYEFRALGGPIIGYDDDGLGEVTFSRRFKERLLLDSHDVFASEPAQLLSFISAKDSRLVEALGTVVSHVLGISFTGFLPDDDPKERGMSVWRKGGWTGDLLKGSRPVSFT